MINDPYKGGGIVDPYKGGGIVDPFQDDWNARLDPNAGMGPLQNLLVGMGRGFTDVGQGVQQWFRGDEYDQRVQDEAALYDRNMDSGLATLGRVGGNLAATAIPGGAAARLANAGRSAVGLGQAVRAGGAAGATEGALLADTTGQGKFEQIATAALLGGAGGAAAEGALSALGGVVNAPRRAVEGLTAPRQGFLGRIAGTVDDMAEGNRLAAATGIDLSPAQRSGGKAATMAENLSRQSIFSIDEAFEADSIRASQMVNAVRNLAERLGPASDSITAAKSVQSAVDDMARTLAKSRSEFGRRAYGEIDRVAGGAPIVDTANTRAAIARILDEIAGVQGADAGKVAAQGAAFLKAFEEGPITAQKALRQLQAWSQAARGTGRVFDDVTPGYDRVLARRLSDAIMADLDEVATQGGPLGELVRAANDGWRTRTQQIEALRQSLLGEVVGEEFADEISGVAFNRLAPEKVFNKLRNAPASQIEVAKQYLTEHNPEVWQQFQRSVLEEALQEAQASAPSMGANVLPINPGAFVKALTGSSGRQSVARTNQLKAIFGDTDVFPVLQDVLEAGTRMADSTGRNFSGTAPAQEVYGLLNSILGSLKGAGQGVLNIMGARQVARNMTPGAPALPYYSAPRVGPFGVPLAGIAGLGAAQAFNTSSQQDR